MTRELISGKLSIGDRAACNAPRLHSAGKSACIVHGCKTCHQAKAGKLSPTDKRYLSFVEQGDLYLNLIDATTAYFQTQSFTAFLRFARDNWLDDRPITIHCDQGRSRAPMLAVLFMAKVLEIIPNTSLDDAMDAFEAQHGKLEPSEGIETYLRKNWHGIESMPVNYRGPNRRSQQYRPPDTSQITNDEAVALIQGSPIVHFATMVEIEDKDHNMVTPVPNILQMRINEAYEWCIENGIAPRLQALKPRQKGSSTFFGELFYHHARRFHTDGLIIGDESSRVMKVWQIFTEYSIRDKFPWDSKFAYDTKKASFTYADGTKGLWEYDTANDPKAGISGTRQAIWYTEAARYPKSGSRTDVKVITASLASLSKGPRSLAAMESTAEGANGFFYNNWQGAVSLEDMKAGKFGNGWIKIFAAWFEFADGVLPRAPHYEEHFHTTYSYREKRGRQLYGWTAEQIAWRRYTIASECDGDESIFDQDYPENDRDCFLQSGRPRFDDDGVTRLEIMAEREHDLAERGILTGSEANVIFVPQKEDAWLWLKEKPIRGCAYIVAIDPCQGSQSNGAKNPDAHACVVLRQPYICEKNVLHPVAVVAAIHVEPSGCRWDASIVAERTAMLANYFGGCMVCPETGNGLDVLVKLRDFGANIYQRQKQDHFIPGKLMPTLGFETNSSTRDMWVGSIADAIREGEFECAFKPAVSEMRTFIITDRGKAEAAPSKHDDWIAAIGIGLLLIKFAGVYRPVPPKSFFGGDKKRSSMFS